MALVGEASGKLVGPILLGYWLGTALDRRLGVAPLFLLLFILLGIAAGIFLLVRTLMAVLGDDRRPNSGGGRE
ncbi:AtpZ/AtpI family protein [Hydrogenibacillus schlegelii]|uniref:AtpZ/AtpI family protein n=2 Tax=Bacillales Family X. Incertae Sedis TaxID=539003 RepID=A0A132N9G1_HYDSH|nr:AtpZ/AtpI family protein [Hydrogenibacillus schlegelii]QZA34334.1 AtpZ/AtpI family protein [Hydrogenibacillus sp. N12]KWX06759.1 hypothetical protein TR75_05025 [Hydrogenibacillus schlegelii]MBE3562836.1 AtpZ/AtpI family protein [Hydrogenibacillus schlegelii]MBT9282177.1 AtpZ/AtpI family protein [Hydrogenibacillus schlegelii]OAR04203.1 hypothetical protein SA87_07065 [Hydrogenibacillus schlegelii]